MPVPASFPHDDSAPKQTGWRLAASFGVVRALACVLTITSCSNALNLVPMGAHQATAAQPVRVDSAPPPARLEYVPDPPDGDCAWLDGQWAWVERRWRWYRGAWVKAPKDCYYAPPVMVWVASGARGELYYTHGRWYPEDAGGQCQVPMLCPAKPRAQTPP